MVKALINGIFKVMITIATLITQPFADLITMVFPDITSYLNNIANFFSLITGSIGWFFNFIPPLTRTAIGGIVGFYIALQPLRWAITNASRSLDLLKRLNVFGGK